MSRIYDLLNPPSGGEKANTDAAHPSSSAGKKKARGQLPRLNLHKQWSMELQKIAYHLSSLEGGEDRPMSFTFTSLSEGAGTTTVSYVFAYFLAVDDAHRNVLFVDFNPDTDKPAIAGAKATFFVGQENISAPFSELETNLDVVSVRFGMSGSSAASTTWFRDFMTIAHKAYDIVVVDAPPFAHTPTAYAPAKASDGVVLVLRCGETRYPAINTLVNDLNEMGVATLGAILNHRQYAIPNALLKLI